MAHNTKRIHWDTAHDLYGTHGKNLRKLGRTDDTTLQQFADTIGDTLRQDIVVQRARYIQCEDQSADNDIIISDHTALRITPMVNIWRTNIFFKEGYGGLLLYGPKKYGRWQHRLRWHRNLMDHRGPIYGHTLCSDSTSVKKRLRQDVSRQLCTHIIGTQCRCTLPRRERTAAAFSRGVIFANCYQFLDTGPQEYFASLVMQSLIVSGDLEPFYTGQRQHVTVCQWRKVYECVCVRSTRGWGFLQETCLRSYILLNTFLALTNPKLRNQSVSLRSYRNHAAYKTFTETPFDGDYFQNIHNEFYNKKPPQVSMWKYVPLPFGAEEARLARYALVTKGLPNEIIEKILRCVTRTERICKPGDPLHKSNRAALEQYLDWCWRVVVNCYSLYWHLDAEKSLSIIDIFAELKILN